MGHGALLIATVAACTLVSCSPGDPRIETARTSSAIGYTGTEEAKLIASDSTVFDRLGSAVALSPLVAVTGAKDDDPAGDASGSAHVFRFDGASWGSEGTVTASDGATQNAYGVTVAATDEWVLVGSRTGAYLLERQSGGSWLETQKLLDGSSVIGAAMSGSTAIVSISVPATLRELTRTAGTWSAGQTFQTSDSSPGYAVATSSSVVVVGAPFHNHSSSKPDAGTVYVFERDTGGQWAEVQKLQASDASADARFGTSVSVAGDLMLVGAPFDSESAAAAGAAYIFRSDPTGSWSEEAKLLAADAALNDHLGISVAAFPSVLCVGAEFHDEVAADSGAVYLFSHDGAQWRTDSQLAPAVTKSVHFGAALAGVGNRVLVGAPRDDGGSALSGAAYTYLLSLTDGSPCTLGSECLSGHCVEGVCCDGSCDGACETCLQPAGASADGQCGPRSEGAVAVPPCPAPYQCNGTDSACPSSCTSDASCTASHYCDSTAGDCASKRAIGEPCGADGARACSSGVCADGVCCDRSCGVCEACTAAKKGQGSDGMCESVLAGTDPNDECEADAGFPASCLADGECDGSGACRSFALQSTACGGATCTGNLLAGRLCDGAGSCVDGSATDCAPYACSASACSTSCSQDSDCHSTGYCTSVGTCETRHPDGDPCDRGAQCSSGFCVDGACCNTECGAQCESCTEAGATGTCVVVSGSPRAGRPSCPSGSDPCTARTCDGQTAERCEGYVGAEVICRDAECIEGRAAPAARCDGAGACAAGEPVFCGTYVCADGACKTRCDDDRDCDDGSACSATSECESTSRCSDDSSGVIDANGETTSCSPYRCEGGTCGEECELSSDCAAGFVCESNGQCIAAEQGGEDEPGCGCRVAGNGPSSPSGVPWAAALLALLGRRRRGARRTGAAPLLALVAAVGCVGCGTSPQEAASRSFDPQLDGGVAPPIAAKDGDAYRITRVANATYRSTSLAQRLGATFSSHGVELSPLGAGSLGSPSSGWRARLELERYGCRAAPDPVAPPLLKPDGRRIELRRSHAQNPVIEWYVNTPRGLKQGFDLPGRPACNGAWLALELAVGGDLEIEEEGVDVLGLRDAAGTVRAYYSGLHAFDATGQPVPARLEAERARITLLVDVTSAVFPVTVDPLIGTQQGKLVPTDAAVGTHAGVDVAIDGDTVLVGALDLPGGYRGAGYVFVRDGTGAWSQQDKLTASDGVDDDQLGEDVDLSGDYAILGSKWHNGGAGAAYVFERDGTGAWSASIPLQPTTPLDPADHFGAAVAIDGNTAVVGAYKDDDGGSAAGAAYVFVRTGPATWVQQAKLVATTPGVSDYLGWSVDISGDTVLAGATQEDTGASEAGSVYVFVRSGTTWTEQDQLTASDPVAVLLLGVDVAIDGDTAVLGTGKESAYVFSRSGTTWTEAQKLTASDGTADDSFGEAVAISGDHLVVGAWTDDDRGADSGSVYLFVRNAGTFAEESKILPLDTGPTDFFGRTVSISGDTVTGGTATHDGPAQDSGAAYAFTLALSNGSACTTGGECASGWCVGSVCCDLACAGACETCLASEGATVDGACTPLAEGASGSPACSSPYQCNGTDGDCPATCASDSSCVSTHYCNPPSSACEPKKADGGACTESRECQSDVCEDGVCCDRVCGTCEACTSAKKGSGAEGTCGPVAADADPDDECAADPGFPSSCGADGQCDGAGACRSFAPPSTACGATSCSGDSVVGLACDGSGSCLATSGTSCAPYPCSGGSCAASCAGDAGCAAGAFCTVLGTCTAQLGNGSECQRSGECQSGFCVDGVCCADSCGGQCEACGEDGSLGTCVAVTSAPRGARPPCAAGTATEPCARAECDGSERATCALLAGSSVVCQEASCVDGIERPEGRCDGNGACDAPDAVECGAFQCEGTACRSSCEDSGDCVEGAQCSDGRCVEESVCSDDDGAVLLPDGGTQPCSPYVCKSGTCAAVCGTSAQCAAGFVCEAQECVTAKANESAAEEEGGCGCDVAGRRGTLTPPLVAFLVLLARRRSRAARVTALRPLGR